MHGLNTRFPIEQRKKETNVTFKRNDFVIYQLTPKMHYSRQLGFGAIDLLFSHLFGNERFISVLIPQKWYYLRFRRQQFQVPWRRLHPI